MTTNILRSFVLGIIIFSCFNCSESSEPSEPDNNNPIEVSTESSIKFQKQYQTNDSIFTLNSAVQLLDSSYTIAGAIRYNGSVTKNVIMKFDKYGNRNWIKIMENTYTPNGIEKLFKNGNGYIGYRGHHYDVQNSSHIIYFNETGVVENEIFENKGGRNDMIRDGKNFVIAGSSDGDPLFQMLNQDGELIWKKSYGYFYDVYSISKLTDGNFISIGGANSGTSKNTLIKLNEEGEEIWSKNYRGSNILAISNKEFLAVTNTGGDNGNLVRFDEVGNVIWTKQLDNFRQDVNKPSPTSIINYNMEYFICTYVNQNNNLSILVLNQNGNEINSHIIDDFSGEYTLVSKTIDNGILIAYSGYIFNFGIIKLSNDFLFN